MPLKVARFVNLFLAALLVGNEFGTWSAVHPALSKLPAPEQVRAEQEITHRYGAMMPLWMSSVIVSCLPVLRLVRGRRRDFRFTLAGTICFVAMVLVTLVGNVPINNRVLELSAQPPPEEFLRLRERWDRLHTARNFLNMTGLSCLYAGALTSSRSEPRK